eukprot:CAMPEP_0172614784 /NCGR_PEP_ID=MMETSP1068-20121228/55271_1 /TAXON_ID=35684 /ORGANISM="Pseudopedinella elastica, Strain CCMP716" /LENGTH=73 /DNA_ID=CAMNT_0013419705 /DNA_START=88 /DNA_END=305 /DNA_ORIENTATION=+
MWTAELSMLSSPKGSPQNQVSEAILATACSCPMQPPRPQPQARPPRETAPLSPSKPTPQGESPGKYLQKDGSG